MIELLIVFALGWWLGGLVNTALQRMAFLKILEDLGVSREQLERVKSQNLAAITDSDSEDTEETLEIKLEQHQGVIYAFRKDNDHFLGQGADREQLIDRLKQQFAEGKEIRLIIREEDGANLIKNG